MKWTPDELDIIVCFVKMRLIYEKETHKGANIKNCEFLGSFLKLSIIEIPMEDIRKIWQKEKI